MTLTHGFSITYDNFFIFFTESIAHASYNSTIWQIDSILFLDPLQKYKFIESSVVGGLPEVSFSENIPRTAQLEMPPPSFLLPVNRGGGITCFRGKYRTYSLTKIKLGHKLATSI